MLERALFIYVFSGANVRDVFKMKKVSIHGIVPPTERKADTSSITVVILDEKHYEDVNLSSNEIKLETTRGTERWPA
jgi:protein subunit release factor A